MAYLMTPIAPQMELTVNSNRLGAVRTFSERTVCVPIPVYAIGKTFPVGMVPSKAYYEISISRVLTDKTVFTQPISPHQLHNFTLVISGGGREIRFTGCEYRSVAIRNDAAAGLVEDSVIYASARTERS